MFVIILDGQIIIPLPMYGEAKTPMMYDNLDYMETAISYIRNDTRMVFPLSPTCPEFEDLFPSDPGEEVARYVRCTSVLSGRWLVMEHDGSFWYYAAEKESSGDNATSEMPKLWRERVIVYDNTRILFHSTELTPAHRRVLLGAMRAGADAKAIRAIVAERAIGPVPDLGCWDIGNLLDCLVSVRITKPDFRKAWRESDEGKRRIAQLENSDKAPPNRTSTADAQPAEQPTSPAKPKRRRRVSVRKAKPPAAEKPSVDGPDAS